MTLKEIRLKVDSCLATYNNAKQELEKEKDNLVKAREFYADAVTAQQIVQNTASQVQQQAHTKIAAVVSSCLEAIFDEEQEIYVKRDKIPDTFVPGVSELPGWDGWVVLAVYDDQRVDAKKSELTGSGGVVEAGSESEIIQSSPPDPFGFRGTMPQRNGGLSLSGSERIEQPPDKSALGNPQREHDGKKGARKRKSRKNKSANRGSNQGGVQNSGSNNATVSGQIQSYSGYNSPNNPSQNMVRVRIKKLAYQFKLIFEQKRGKTEARRVFTRAGEEFDPITECGGGVVDVAAFAFRLAALLQIRPTLRKLLILDEPFKHLGRQYAPRVRELLLRLSRDLGIQIVMITHSKDLECGKVVELS